MRVLVAMLSFEIVVLVVPILRDLAALNTAHRYSMVAMIDGESRPVPTMGPTQEGTGQPGDGGPRDVVVNVNPAHLTLTAYPATVDFPGDGGPPGKRQVVEVPAISARATVGGE